MPASPPAPIMVRPMLAKHWKFSAFTPGMFIQPKLDGLRALYQNGQLVSRDGKIWQPAVLKHITEHLVRTIPRDVILDGELYVHGLRLQQINSLAAVNRIKPHDDEHKIAFHVFDCVAGSDFGSRFMRMKSFNFYTLDGPVRIVQTFQIFNHEQSDELYQRWLSEGYEGAMYRHPDRPYATSSLVKNKDNRCDWLLKRKEWADLDGTIIRLNEGQGEHAGRLGSFTVRFMHKGMSAQLVNVGTGLSHQQRALYWDEPERVLNRKIKIRYRTLSTSGIPLEPRVHHIDENLSL